MPTTDLSAKPGIWSRIKSKLKPRKHPQKPESVTLPVMDTFDPDTCRVTEIRFVRKDSD